VGGPGAGTDAPPGNSPKQEVDNAESGSIIDSLAKDTVTQSFLNITKALTSEGSERLKT